ncbi:MAG: class I SAM-dependent methyltransferase [Labilithrix sp.]|nr:class I SAM-dependent methyltransferase [Labilithrix sp.]MCW5816800.1 class I SAM-dependent methyltransferase [Labilithrix sp.]
MNAGPSTTAAVVASTLLLLEDDPALAPLAFPEATPSVEAAVRHALPIVGRLLDTIPWPVLERAAHVAERLVSPGFVAHYALRKFAIRRALARETAAGCGQVVLVGAGFDMMAESLPAAATIVEVDHPATQRLRREAASSRAVTFVPLDLATGDLAAALDATAALDPAAATTFVAEGLLMYLARDRVEAILSALARGPGARTVILSIVTPDRAGKVRIHTQRRVVDWIMRWIDEPFVWGESATELVRTLEQHGFAVEELVTTMALRDELIAPDARRCLPRSPGEIVVVAKKRAA